MPTQRLSGKHKGRCRAVAQAGLVYTVATDTTSADSIADQTRNTLRALETNLVDAGSSKQALLQVTIYLSDITMKADMDAVWCDWIGAEENWPQRACIGVDLAGNDMIEIVATAALS